MSESFAVPVCTACGHAIWPPRPLCPRCGCTSFEQRAVTTGVIEEWTAGAEHSLASVRTQAGPVAIARLVREAPAGTTVELCWDRAPDRDAALVATPRD